MLARGISTLTKAFFYKLNNFRCTRERIKLMKRNGFYQGIIHAKADLELRLFSEVCGCICVQTEEWDEIRVCMPADLREGY